MQFTSCHRGVFAAASDEVASAGAAPRTGGRRREIVVGGRRVKTIDIHAHCVIPEAQDVLGIPNRDVRFGRGIEEVGAQRLQVMDEQGIDVEALSINPTWYRADRATAERVVSIQNERLAEYCAAMPDRFVAFASVALQFPDLAATQLQDSRTARRWTSECSIGQIAQRVAPSAWPESFGCAGQAAQRD